MKRREFFKQLGSVAVVAATISPTMSFAASAPKSANALSYKDALNAITGGKKPATSSKVKLKVPEIAENGAVVPLQVTSDLAGKTVAIFQDANPESLVAVFTVPANGIIDFKIRIKMAKTGNVTAVVQDGNTLYSHTKEVKVTAGGCGG